MAPDYALPHGSKILVTGANGYIASHVVDQMLALGYVVRGTVRSQKPWLNEYFDKKYGADAFETFIVSSFDDTSAVEEALDGVDGVIHLVSDLSFGSDPKAVIPWVVQATLNILEVASRKTSIKRVVLTSSSSATYPLTPEPNGRKLDAEERGVAVYAASKTEGERQSWKWIKDHRPQFEFNTVLPCFVVGKILHPEIPGSTMGSVRKLLQGDDTAFSRFPEQWYVDVEDTAKLCAIALLDETVNSERIFAFGEQTNWTDTVSMLRELRPNNRAIPDPPENEMRDRTEVVPRTRAQDLIRRFYGSTGFTPVKKSLAKGIEGW
ncbi:hypothetical protein N7541_002960 [Penicillium brevicompactum]|uniref:NAD-dependent epimerase/dehydratase domain-containing protein n=1 Tax=Penicillium brevicompactum TaxID=5074 RepID=A0A9W9RL25_PENBR|nr:hypothetical protein N7541_002960 [Penicillium brevicompactum]